MRANGKTLISVIVPTYNSERVLDACLKSINAQTYPNIETIVVDNHSTDTTRGIAKKRGASVLLFKGIRSKARNVGASLAHGELLLSIDSDMELTPTAISDCIAKVSAGFDAIIIPEVSIGKGFWARCRALEKDCYKGDDVIEASRFFKRETFEAVNGYDQDLEFGEDWDINQRIMKAGYRVGRANVFIRHNEGYLTLRNAVRKKNHYGKTLRKYVSKHPDKARQQLKIARPAYIRNWKKLARDPVHALGMLFMKACEFASIKLAYLTSERSE